MSSEIARVSGLICKQGDGRGFSSKYEWEYFENLYVPDFTLLGEPRRFIPQQPGWGLRLRADDISPDEFMFYEDAAIKHETITISGIIDRSSGLSFIGKVCVNCGEIDMKSKLEYDDIKRKHVYKTKISASIEFLGVGPYKIVLRNEKPKAELSVPLKAFPRRG